MTSHYHRAAQVVAGLQEGGLTLMNVEQPLNIALDIADQAFPLDKGHVISSMGDARW